MTEKLFSLLNKEGIIHTQKKTQTKKFYVNPHYDIRVMPWFHMSQKKQTNKQQQQKPQTFTVLPIRSTKL